MDGTTVVSQGDADSSAVRAGNQYWSSYYGSNFGIVSNQFLYAPGNTNSNDYHVEIYTHYGEDIFVNRSYAHNNTQNEYSTTVSNITLMEVVA